MYCQKLYTVHEYTRVRLNYVFLYFVSIFYFWGGGKSDTVPCPLDTLERVQNKMAVRRPKGENQLKHGGAVVLKARRL